MSQRRFSQPSTEDLCAGSHDSKLPLNHSSTSLVPCPVAQEPTEEARPSRSHQKAFRATTATSVPQGSQPLLEAEFVSCVTAERRKFLGDDGRQQPAVTNEQPTVNTEIAKVQSGTQVEPLLGEVACFSSRTPFPPWPAGYFPYMAPAFNQSLSSSPASSPQSSSDSLRGRMDTQFLMSGGNDMRSTQMDRTMSTTGSTRSYDSFGPTRSIDTSSRGKPASVEVSIAAGRPNMAKAFTSTIRAVIGTMFNRSRDRDITIETTFIKGRSDLPGQAGRSIRDGNQDTLQEPRPPPPPPPPPPPGQQILESLSQNEPVKITAPQCLNDKPSVESMALAKPVGMTPAPGVPGPAITLRTVQGSNVSKPHDVMPTPPVSDAARPVAAPMAMPVPKRRQSASAPSGPAPPTLTQNRSSGSLRRSSVAAQSGIASSNPAVPSSAMSKRRKSSSVTSGPALPTILRTDPAVPNRRQSVTATPGSGPSALTPSAAQRRHSIHATSGSVPPAPITSATQRRQSVPATSSTAKLVPATSATAMSQRRQSVPSSYGSVPSAPKPSTTVMSQRRQSVPATSGSVPSVLTSDAAVPQRRQSVSTVAGAASSNAAASTSALSAYGAQQTAAREPVRRDSIRRLPVNVPEEHIAALNTVLRGVPRAWLQLISAEARTATAAVKAQTGAVSTTLLNPHHVPSGTGNVLQDNQPAGTHSGVVAREGHLPMLVAAAFTGNSETNASICAPMEASSLLNKLASLQGQIVGTAINPSATLEKRRSSLPLQKAAVVGANSKAPSKTGTPNAGTPIRRPSVSSVGKRPSRTEMERRLSTNKTTPSAHTVASGPRGAHGIAVKGAAPARGTPLPAKKCTSQPSLPSSGIAARLRAVSSDSAITGQKKGVGATPVAFLDEQNVGGVRILQQLQEQERAALMPLQAASVGNQHVFVASGMQITIRPTRDGDCSGTVPSGPPSEASVLPGVVLEVERSKEAGANVLDSVYDNALATISPLRALLPTVVSQQVKKSGSTGSIYNQPSVIGAHVPQETEAIVPVPSEPHPAFQIGQRIVAVPREEQASPENGGVFPGLTVPPSADADGHQNLPEGTSCEPPIRDPGAALPGATMNIVGLNPSAAAPSAAAPSAAAPRLLGAPFPRVLPPHLQGPQNIRVPQPVVQYAETKEPNVSALKVPVSMKPRGLRGRDGAKEEARKGEGEGDPEGARSKSQCLTAAGENGTVTRVAMFEESALADRVIKAEKARNCTFKRTRALKKVVRKKSEGVANNELVTLRHSVSPVCKKTKETVSVAIESRELRPKERMFIAAEKGESKLSRSDGASEIKAEVPLTRAPKAKLPPDESPIKQSKAAGAGVANNELVTLRHSVSPVCKKAKETVSVAIESRELRPKESVFIAAEKGESKLSRSDGASEIKAEVPLTCAPKAKLPPDQSPIRQSKAAGAGEKPDNACSKSITGVSRALTHAISAACAEKSPALSKPELSEAYAVSISTNETPYSRVVSTSDKLPRYCDSRKPVHSATAVVETTHHGVAMGPHLEYVEDAGASATVPRRESVTCPSSRKLGGALGHPTLQPEQPSSCNIPNLVENVEGCGILSQDVQENKSEKCAVQGTVQNKVDRSSEHNQETPEHRERREEIVQNKRACPNRQVEMEPRVAHVHADESPSWSLLGCTLGLVGMVLMLLLTVIYSLTTSVSLPLTTQASSPLSTKLDIIYCSSQFCDREADYIKSSLGSSGKRACENFYEHVCGAWPQAHPLYSTAGAGAAVSSDTIIQEKLDEQLASLLASSNADDLGVASAMYEACTDRKKADMAVNDIKELMKTWTIHEWPRDSNGTMKDTWKFAGELVRDLGVSSILDAVLAAGSQYTDHVVVELRKPTDIFSCSGPLRPPVISLVRAALHDIAVEFTQARKAEILEEVMNAFVRLGSSSCGPSVVEFGGTKFTESAVSVVKLSDLDSDMIHFLNVAFGGAIRLERTTIVFLRQPRYLLDYLTSVVRDLTPRALMNYMGFMALVQLSAFLPERHAHLRQLFAKGMRERTFPDVSNSSVLCAMAVERILPDCFNKLSSAIFRDAEYDARVPEKLSLLEDAFARHIGHLSWMSDELVIMNRYRMKRQRTSQLGPSTSANSSDSCVPSHVTWHKNSPVEFYRAVSRAQHDAACQLVIGGGAPSSDASLRPSAVRAAYDPLLGRVQVPAALFNTSVPGNSAGFSLQLARYAVRFYRTLLEALFVDERGHIGPDDASRRRLEALLQCFEWDLRELPTALQGPVTPDPAMSRGAILQQTAALQLAFRTFHELWQVRRAWNADFRYRRLPELSAEALFFVYYALDNCENSDQVYKESQGQWLPAEYRVNLPLRHIVEFASLFNCSADANMGLMGLGRTCAVVTPDTWSIRAPGDS